ncbi:MAG TPA: VCBS repeat-containing protein [Planctomycetota bacterium]|nr:VCBS repeat-containing protein [Planctomycetota bacterium]
MRPTRTAISRLLLIGLLPLSGCGAGLITGVAVSNSDDPVARVPELSVSPVLPLVPPAGTVRTVVVANAQITATPPRLRVRLEGAGVGQDQLSPMPSSQGGSTLITFTLDTAAIAAAAGDPTAANVNAQLSVFVDDQAVAPAVPVTLARQPRAELVLEPAKQELFLSPLGERVLIRVHGLLSTQVAGLEVLVTTPDPSTTGPPQPTITRLASDVRFEPAGGGAPVISAFVPGNSFPVRAVLVVRDVEAGQSTPVENAYYEPNIAIALPRQGPTTGGSLVTLIGTALVPLDFSQGTPTPAWDDVELSFEKGDPDQAGPLRGRITTLAPQDFRTAESGSDRLVFTMPPSPDGRPGQVDIVLRVTLGSVVAEVTASGYFLFSNPDPFFGPRGTVLERLPVTVAPIALDGAPSTGDAPDFVALTDPGGVGFLQLLLAQENGMFQRFAAPRQIGDHEVPAERLPRDLCIGDFDGDLIPDVYIANEGAATAVHHVVLGQRRPKPPLGAVWPIDADPGTWKCRTAFFDGDSFPDVLLVPGPNAPPGLQPQVRLARPVDIGHPAFTSSIVVPLQRFRYEAVEVADLNDDGKVDIAVVSGGTELVLQVAWGRGDGTFDVFGQALAFGAPPAATAHALEVTPFLIGGTYLPHPDSVAVGLHACRDGPLQSLGLVLSGVAPSVSLETRPTVTVFRQPTEHTFVSPLASETTSLLIEPIGLSLVADLDVDGKVEMVVAMRDDPLLVSLGLLQFRNGGFTPISIVAIGAESPRKIRALVFDRAFPATQLSPEKKAVFIVHETEIDASTERRLSTLLVQRVPELQQPRLLPPDAGNSVGFGIQNLVGGNFHDVSVAGGGAVRDLALVQQEPDEIVLVKNDGFGGFPELSNRLAFPGLLPHSLTLLPSPSPQVDRLLFCGSDSRLGVWQRDDVALRNEAIPTMYQQVDALSEPLVTGTPLSDGTRMQVGDVDGDGIPDLVVLLSFAQPTSGETARLALLRGKPGYAPGEFPFLLPTTLTPVHSNASSITLGDFTNAGLGQPKRLELAVAVPVGTSPGAPDGDHIRFYRYVAGAMPAGDRFEASARPDGPQVLLAGSAPTQVVAGDFDRDGLVDLLVACKDDSTLRLFRNTAAVTSSPGHVAVGAFHEGLTSPRPLAPGAPTVLRLSDVNGDGSVDCVVWVESTSGSVRSTTVASYLSSGAGEFVGPRFASPTRIGNRDAVLSGDLGDWNRDDLPDLLLGWNTSTVTNDINLRVMFGGTR